MYNCNYTYPFQGIPLCLEGGLQIKLSGKANIFFDVKGNVLITSIALKIGGHLTPLIFCGWLFALVKEALKTDDNIGKIRAAIKRDCPELFKGDAP